MATAVRKKTRRGQKNRVAKKSASSSKPQTTTPKAETNPEAALPNLGETNELDRIDSTGIGLGRLSLLVLTLLAMVHAAYFARSILFPVVLSVVLFFLLAPLVRFLTKLRFVSESIAAAAVVLCVTGLVGIGSYTLSGPLTNWFASAPETFREAESKLRFMTDPMHKLDEATDSVKQIAGGAGQENVVEVAIKQPPITSYLLNATMNFLAGAIITIVLVYLLLAMGHRTLNSVVELIPTIEDKRGFVAMIRDVEHGISQYLLTITGINIGLGIVIGTALGLLGMPDPHLLGLMATALNFIPFVGCLVGTAVTFLIGVVYLDTPTQFVLAPLLYLSINALEGNAITPMILGRSMNLNPVFVFLFIVFWGWVWGVGGILIAVPLLGILKIVSDHSAALKPVARIISG